MINNISNTYKLPWVEFDNPNGWIEPTTKCNIICPGCYRGTDNETLPKETVSLDELKKQVDWFKKYRNIHTISIAGGEPTLYPHLRELIAYASKLNLRTMLFTNGLLLTREFATELASEGLNQLVIHIDRFQKRPDMQNISSLDLKQIFVNRLANIPNLQIGFIQPVSESCESEVASVMEFLKNNFNVVNLMIFTIYRNICETSKHNPEIEGNLTTLDLLKTIKKHSDIEPAAYLQSVNDSKMPTWLFSQRIGYRGVILGNVSSSIYKAIHQKYRIKNKRFLFISRTNSMKILSLLRYIYRSSIVKIFVKYMYHGFKTRNWNKGLVNFQTILLLRGPEKQDNKWDLCVGCPDKIIYNGKLLPSCILENIKGQKNIEFNDVSI